MGVVISARRAGAKGFNIYVKSHPSDAEQLKWWLVAKHQKIADDHNVYNRTPMQRHRLWRYMEDGRKLKWRLIRNLCSQTFVDAK
jgi:hypothetical protein